MAPSSPAQGYRELAQRVSDGLTIILFWHERSNSLMVAVSDARTGAYFELEAASDEALHVFDHPFAYAAARGVPYDSNRLPSWPQRPAKVPANGREPRSSERRR
jgi:hypothetical protein